MEHSLDTENIKKWTYFEVGRGCCEKFAPLFKRDNIQWIMKLMKHSLGIPIPEHSLDLKIINRSSEEPPFLWPTKEVAQKVENK